MHKKMHPLHVMEARTWLNDTSMHYLGQALAAPGQIKAGDAYALLLGCDVKNGIALHPCIDFLRRGRDKSFGLHPQEIITTDPHLRAPLALAATALHTDGHLTRMLIQLSAQVGKSFASTVRLMVTADYICAYSRLINTAPQTSESPTYKALLCAIVPPSHGQAHAKLKTFQNLTRNLPMLEQIFGDKTSTFKPGDGLEIAEPVTRTQGQPA